MGWGDTGATVLLVSLIIMFVVLFVFPTTKADLHTNDKSLNMTFGENFTSTVGYWTENGKNITTPCNPNTQIRVVSCIPIDYINRSG